MSSKKIANIYPLSPMQEGMLFHSLLDEGTESYFEQLRFTIRGFIDPAILEQSLNALIARHDILRTVFILEKVQKPRQIVLKERKTNVQVIDITHLSEDEQAIFLEDYAKKERQKNFDLAKDVLIRLTLIQTSSDAYTLIWSHHHILLDGWCIPIVLHDFFQIYQQVKDEQPVNLGQVYPYSKYISWLGEQDAEEAKDNWSRYLSDYEPTTFIQKQGTGIKYNQAELVFTIGQSLTTELNHIARQLQVTVNNLFRTIWGLMLQRQSNIDDVVFGSVVSGRPIDIPNVEQMVGLFINTVPIRVQMRDNQTFSDLVKQVQEESSSLEKYHYLSLADIQKNQQLIDHIILFQNYPMGAELLTRLNQYNQEFTLTKLHAFEQTNYDLNIMVTADDTLTVTYLYNASVLTEDQLQHLNQQLITIMTQVTNTPDILLKNLEIINSEEKHLQLHTFNDTYRHYPVDFLIHQIFEDRAEKQPHHIALVMGEQKLTYRELNEKANQLATFLRAKGVGPESIVSLLTERSAEMIIAILAIFKAGGAYLPIDPAHPKDRIEYILQDSGSVLLLTKKRFLETIDFADRIFDLEADELYQGAPGNLANVAQTSNLAYVIYTSGSTGKPKGVMIEHASLLNQIFALQEQYPLQEKDAYLLKTTYTFDVSVAEIFGWILGNGRLVILEPGAEKEPDKIWESIVNYDVTHVNFVPSMLILFVEYLEGRKEANRLRYIMAAGEAMPNDLASRVYQVLPEVKVENIYGPTEATIYASCYSLTADLIENPVPIGKPLANYQMHIVNQHGQLQPIGVPGELCIAGAGLARGYLNNEELTNEKFVPHPFEAGKRMYRTGDLARYRKDGNIEYLGRIDHQVKIRGFRIELNEIRSRLIEEESIRDAVVVAQTDHNHQAYLCAYIIADQMWTVASLRTLLRQTLPDYMVPSHFIQMEEFPLTSSGKIDRKALPLPDGNVQTGNAYSAPRNPIEELLARIWEEVLGVSRVGIHDNFFEMGGHSLLATQLLSRTSKVFQTQLQMREIFTYQTVAELAERIQITRQGAEPIKQIPIKPLSLDSTQELPLSFAQQRLWFLDQLIPNSAMYNIPVGFHLRGAVDTNVMERALNEMINRHESLRTTVKDIEGRAVQVIHTQVHFPLPVTDLRDLPAEEKDTIWMSMVEEDGATPFQLDHWPLMRAALIRLEEQESVLWINMHHIISDGWSMDVLVNELSTIYEAFVKEAEVPLADLPIQYRDYAVWQRENWQGNVWDQQLSYWKKKLGQSEPLLPLPTDRPRTVVQSYRGDNYSFYVPSEVGQKLRELGRQEGATLFMTLLAAFKHFMYRYTHTTDILIGTPVAGRNRQEIENLIGFFVNMLVLRTDLSNDPTFVELLRRVRETAFDAFANQDIPFEKLVDELQIERSLSYSPLFQVLFSVQGMSTGVRKGETISITPNEVSLNKTTKFDLTLTMIEDEDDGLKGVFEYSTDLFDRTTIERMAEHFRNLLQAVATNPAQKITEVELLGDGERDQLLVGWNDTEVDYSRDLCVHELVTEIAQKLPDQLAVSGEQGAITYAELDAKANQLAHFLLKQGIGSEDLIGICVERSIEMLIGQLAILKAGAAYVPMDPAYPQERLAFMIKNAQMSLVLTQERLVSALPEGAATFLCLDRDWDVMATMSSVAPAVTTKAEQLAYVIYTSGSTGTPKGVEIEHRSLLNLIHWHQRAYNLNAADRASQIAGTAFDASVWEIWPYLTAGATICLPQEEIRLVPEKLRDWIVESGITISFLPTPLAESLLTVNWPAGSALRYMLTGGDTLHQYPSANLPFTLVNQYGPTENTVVATAGIVPVQGEREAAPSIGRPIDNVSVYVLDASRKSVPVGVVGELYIAGKSLARGYLNRPDLTEASFVPNPFSTDEGARMYRTGDLVRYLADGSLEFIGRADDQVSIRGFRVELGEIESALYAHAAVSEAVVIVREDLTPGVKRLVAYAVLHEGEEVQTNELRQSLKDRLPDYMVPSVIILMDALPLTPNGKVDRRALPLPDTVRAQWEDGYVAPQTEIEYKLAEIWQGVLGVESIGIHDNFFELGGDSILTIQIVARANQAGIRFTPKHLFDSQTLAELAASVVVLEDTPQVHREQGVVTGELPLTPIQTWFFEQDICHVNHWNQSVMLAVREEMDASLLAKAFAAILAHHDALRLRFRNVNGKWEQYHDVVSDEDVFQVVDLTKAVRETEIEEQMQAIADELQESLDIEKGPLLRAAYFQCEDKQRLFIAIHHLAVDGVSWRIILEDLQTAYQQLVELQQLNLPQKTTSFKRWSEQLTQYAEQSVVDEYWATLDTSHVVNLPVDHPNGKNTEGLAVQVKVKLGVDETRALLQEVPAAYRTQINDVLLSALIRAYNNWTGQQTLYVSVEGHGREEIIDGVDISRTVGWFTSMYPVLLEMEPQTPWGSLIKSVKEQLRSIPDKGIGYGIHRYLSKDKQTINTLQAYRQPEISFNYLGQFDQDQTADASLFQIIPNWSASNLSRDEARIHTLDFQSMVAGDQLEMTWTYSGDMYEQQTIEELARDYVQSLQAIVVHCRSEEAGGFTPSDFALAELNQTSLDKFIGNNRLIENIYTLTPLQEGMLFHSLYEQAGGDYVVQLVVNLDHLNVAMFSDAWQKVVERHAILRTSFLWSGLDKPHQIVHTKVTAHIEHLDWSHLPKEKQEANLQTYLEQDRKRGFDLANPPLMRWSLIRLDSKTSQLVWSFHHILLDGWSTPIVLNDWLAFYQASVDGTKAELPVAPPFSTYIAWLKQQSLEASEQYWRKHLRGFRTPTPLSMGKPGGRAVQQKEYADQMILLSKETTASLQAFARRHQLTMNTLVQGAWALILSRYAGESEVVFGTTNLGRPTDLGGVDSMVGLFINTLPVRVLFSEQVTVIDWLQSIQQEQSAIRQYEFTPLVDIQSWSEVPLGQALFDSILVFENYMSGAKTNANTDMSLNAIQAVEQTNYPLTLVAAPGEELLLKLIYETNRFDQITMDKVLAQLIKVLESIMAQPTDHLSTISFITDEERHKLLVEWNATETEYARDAVMHQLFEAQVVATPDAEALIVGEERLTYAELNRRANQLAHYLRAQGIGSEVLVAVLMERTTEMIVAMMGILKAGGAYVPIDPAYPQERIGYTLEDSQAAILLTQGSLLSMLPAQTAKVICLDRDWEAIAEQSEENLPNLVAPTNLSYVIYTSGSTGLPKGVAIQHSSVIAFIAWAKTVFSAEEMSGVLASTSICFDLSVYEIFVTLAYGGKVILADNALHLPSLPAVNEVTLINTVPSAAKELVRMNAIPSTVKVVNLAGEPLPNTLAQSLYALGHVEKVFNLYGPSEDTTYSTYVMVTKGATSEPTIGRPLSNTQAYILDANLQPVPLGLPGELYLGGDGLARGYLNRSELTAERFLSNPFHADPQARMYGTGDLVRYLPDGQIEYLGRIDHQVKIRGYRIELGELEAVLRTHPAVKEAVVMAREDKQGDKRLAAYVTKREESSEEAADLAVWAKAKLPEFMVPSVFVWLDAMPLTPNGKIDRKQLPEPEWGQIASTQEYVAPRNQTEELVATIWSQVLGIEKVGVHDNFFELGGHSLLATRVISRLREMFAEEVPIRTLFENPTVAELSESLGSFLQETTGTSIEPVSREGHLPLSFAQQRLWFLDRLMPDSALYNIPSAMRLHGDLNIEAWNKSLQVLIQRHESLRTTFDHVDGQAVQIIHPYQEQSLRVIDLCELPADECEAETQRLAGIEAATPFNLSEGPLFRTTLIRISEQEAVFLFNMHHIIFDGWSIGIFIKEMRALYEAFVYGKEPGLADLTLQYADYAVWQRKWMEEDVLTRQLAYWKEKLVDAEPLLVLPTDRPRPSIQSHAGAMYTFTLSAELLAKLSMLSREEGSTLFMTLLAAFQTLLYRYSGQEDILVGSPVAGRNREEIESLIGFFINTLVLRTDMSGEPTFRDLLARVKETALEAYAHQDLPFEKLVDELALERSLSYSPLFQVMFVLQNFQLDLDEQAGIRVLEFDMDKHLVTAKYDLTLTMAEKQDGLIATFEYNTALFDETTIVRMSQHFHHLLEAIVQMPEQTITQLPLLPQAEREQLLVEWNDTTTAYPREQRVDQLFQQTAMRYPNRIAVVAGDQSLTYSQLESRANQVANYLQKQGVRPGSLVGICVKRSLEMLIGVLGILKAGGAYVPLDSDYPKERLAYMMDDAHVTVLLTQEQLLPSLPSGEHTIICLDRDWAMMDEESERAPDIDTTAESLAYVIYTSGSTGLPKGTLVIHRGIVRLVKETDYVTITEQDVFLQASTVSFDAATFEIWGSLLNGAKLVLMPPDLPSLEELGQAIQTHKVTTLWLTAGLFTLMVDHHKEYLTGVRQLLVGGDVVSVPHVRKALELEGLTIINGYGPTENTTFTCCYPVTELPDTISSFPIGRPIKNTTVYVLDSKMQPVPIGVTGELYIGGDGLATGYLNRPDLTEERFVPNPFSTDPQARLYRTGDLVRYLPDGLIEFIGRIDNQVKVRGFRIELSEVESVLAKHPALAASVVIVREDEPGKKQLVAYAVKQAKHEVDTAELRQHFKAHVPDYMVPSAFVMLDELPLTPNGKVDRRALPKPDYAHTSDEHYVAPHTLIERKLSEIWQDVLRIQEISINANFFELGGDSILSIQIVSRANQAGIRLTPKQIFENQTIAELAALVSTTGNGESAIQLAEQGLVTGNVLLTPIQKWFFAANQPSIHHWNQSFLLTVEEPVDTSALERAIAELIAHHDALRMRYTNNDGIWSQHIEGLGEPAPFHSVDLSGIAAEEQFARLEEIAGEKQTSLNITEGPMFRAVYFHLGKERAGRLLLVIHHLVVDGVSWRILLEDLQLAYEQAVNGQEVHFPSKTTSLKAWAEQLHAYAKSESLDKEKAFWANQAYEVDPLPVDRTYEPAQNIEASTKQITLTLTAEETRTLLHETLPSYRLQINDVLLASLAKALNRWTGKEKMVVTLEGHGREEIIEGADLSHTVGWFTSMYPIQISIEQEKPWGHTLKAVKEQLRQIPNKGVGYGILRYLSDDLELQHQLNAQLKPQISFNYLGQFDQTVAVSSTFGIASECSGANLAPDSNRENLLDIISAVTGDQLHVTWLYNENIHDEQTIAAVADHYMEALREIMTYTQSAEEIGYTPSDFPLANLNQQSIDKYIASDRQLENVYLLTPLQEGMLFHSLYEQEGGDYVVQFLMTVRDISLTAFEQAWQRIVDRHSILRTSFIWEGLEQPHQIVRKQVKVSVEKIDLRHVDADKQEAEIQSYMEKDRVRNFSLNQAPLMRWTLFSTNDHTYRFLWSFHHILLDGWSMPLVLQDWQASYQAIDKGEEEKLEAVQPFSRYIAWLHKQDKQVAERYWREQLKGFYESTPLAMGKAGSHAIQPKAYRDRTVSLSKEVTEHLQAFARKQQLTLNTLVQGAWALILSGYSGSDDVVFGTTVSGRPAELPGVENMVGLFINTLPVRVMFDPSQTIQEWLQHLQKTQLDIRQYEYTPLVDVQGWSEVSHGQSLFDSILVFENYLNSTSEGSDSGVSLSEVQAVEQTNYPLTLVVAPGDELALKLIYEQGRFDSEAIVKVLEQMSQVLHALTAQAEQPLTTLSFITDEERHKLLVEWNATETEYARDAVMHQLFEAQVVATPDAEALIVGEERLTYAELNRRANQLAHYLRSQGIGPEVLVAVLMERTTEMIVAMMGILKAGGAYVPIDPAYPQERIGYTLEDSQAAILLTQGSLLSMLPEHTAQVICLDRDWEIIAEQSEENLLNLVEPTNLSYVIYTSGSTGLPKGVAIQHSSVIAFIAWAKTVFSAEEMSGVLASTSICFDLSVYEIFVTLSYGGKVILADNALHVPSLPAANEVTLINTVPSAAKELVRINAIPATVKVVNLAGEPLPNTLAQSLYALEHVEKVFNLYGPSEDTTYSTYVQVTKGATSEPTIGRPLSNTQAYILDANLQPVPLGLPGELYLGGDGLARGYLNRPELTKERFLSNPFHADPQARMYGTGDLVRYLPDGQIEYLGRIDHQVKIRGYRIELGELEAVLRTHPAVKEAVVMAREDKQGDKRLAAYVTTREESSEEATDLAVWAKAKLPEFMVPSVFVWLDAMPLTPNGKIDRKQLPEPEWGQITSTQEYVAPRNQTEELVATIWSQVLGIEKVGVHDNFFELGGHSLLATRVISRLREMFAGEVPIRTLFENPTVAELSEALGSFLQETTGTSIVPVSREGHLPLSFAQQRLWFLDRLMPDSALYNIPSAMRLHGDLNIEAWNKSLQLLIQLHESLRTTFDHVDGQAVQIIHPYQEQSLRVIDLRELPADECEAETQRLAGVEAATPFNLSEGPLFRTTLIRVSEQETVFLLNMHHIISDGWSMGVFIREWFTSYEAISQNDLPALVDLPVQYADYAVWQRDWLQGSVLDEQLSYWSEKLSGAEPLLTLPTDRSRPAVQTYEGAIYSTTLAGELLDKLQTLSRKEESTLFMTLLAAFQTLLYRYSGQDDILVGSPVAGRNRPETEQLIGFFINTMVLRTNMSGEPTFRDLLARVKETALEAYAHQDLPFEKLVDELALERSLSYSPLFQVMFVLQNFQLDLDEKAGIRVSEFDMDKHLVTAKYDLTLTMAEKQDGLIATFEYNTALFDETTIVRMSQHFHHLLEAIVQMPEQTITQLPFLPQAEREQLLVEWNDTTTAYPRDQRVDQLFQQTAMLYPNRIAVVSGDRSLTYSQLETRANQVANYLQKQGVRPGSLVGICVKRSLEMLIGVLGILKAGGAYVPLDSDYPKERLAYMMDDARVTVLLTQEQLLPSLPSGEHIVICLDCDWVMIAEESEQAPDIDTTAESLAYVIYTSGSTGLPKGTLVIHRGIVRLVKETDYVTITEQDVFLQASTVSFDAATFEIWGSLLNGAKLVLMPPDLPSLEELGQAIQTHKVTTLWLTAGLFTLMVDHHKESLTGVRQLLVGGDVVSVPHVRKALELEGLTIINGYGPTENTTFTCCYPVTELPETISSFPIGRPIKNTTVYVLDSKMQPVPIGVTGELYIGGDGLANGYLNRPDLTEERFVPNPYSTDPQARLYRTGDLVRYLPDGLIEFIGRIDNQVKVRGFRIELSEVESVLAKHPALAASVVIVREDEPGKKQLVAYAVKQAEQEVDTAELRQHFKAHVPDYMVPSAFVMLDELPLTPNGKVDRKALPVPVYDRSHDVDSFTEATNLIEQKLVEIWCGVLRMDRIGIHDNFFELGGDSILSIQIVARANKAGIHLTPKNLFDHQTIAELAKVAGQSTKVEAEQGMVTGEAPLLPIQTWFFEQEQPTPHHWNQSMLLQVNEQLDEEHLEQAITHLLAHHDALRLRYTYTDGQWKQTHAEVESEVLLVVEDLSMVSPAQHSRRIAKLSHQAQASLDLVNGPLIKIVYFDLGYDRPGRLLIVIHHLAVDGVSWRVLIEDLQTAYRQAAEGTEIHLPAKTTSYKAWAEKMIEYASSERIVAEKEYWVAAADEMMSTTTPIHDSGSNTEGNCRTITIAMEEQETETLLQKVPSRYRAQINDVLLTALALAHAKWTGEQALLVNLEGHGREELFSEVDLSRTVGWFTSMYPLLIRLDQNMSQEDALVRVKEKLQQIPNKGLGYGILRYLTKDNEASEKLATIPQPPISFNYLGQFNQAGEGDSLFGFAEGERGSNISPDNRRAHLIDVVGAVTGGKLNLSFLYSESLHSEASIETFARHFTEILRSLIQAEKQSYRAEDFEDADLSQMALNKVLSKLKKRKGN